MPADQIDYLRPGASLLQKTITKRQPGYEEYIATTYAFFPGPPKGG